VVALERQGGGAEPERRAALRAENREQQQRIVGTRVRDFAAKREFTGHAAIIARRRGGGSKSVATDDVAKKLPALSSRRAGSPASAAASRAGPGRAPTRRGRTPVSGCSARWPGPSRRAWRR